MMLMYGTDKNINVLNGKELTKIEKNGEYELKFHTKEGEIYRMYHEQDCCEHVYIEDIIGDLDDLIDSPITMAEQISEDRPPLDEDEESYTWTFYKFATIKGYVTIRWYGSSNGYYSESVDFVLENNE
jgi:hypothetical protein